MSARIRLKVQINKRNIVKYLLKISEMPFFKQIRSGIESFALKLLLMQIEVAFVFTFDNKPFPRTVLECFDITSDMTIDVYHVSKYSVNIIGPFANSVMQFMPQCLFPITYY